MQSIDKVIHRRNLIDMKFLPDGKLDFSHESEIEDAPLIVLDKPRVTRRKIMKDLKNKKIKEFLESFEPDQASKLKSSYNNRKTASEVLKPEESVFQYVKDLDNIIDFYKTSKTKEMSEEGDRNITRKVVFESGLAKAPMIT